MAAWQAVLVCVLMGVGWAEAAPERRACASAPAEAVPLSPAAERLFQKVSATLGASPTLGGSPDVDPFCVTRTTVFVHPGDMAPAFSDGPPAQAVATARLAYAVAAWIATQRRSKSLELDAARATGCALAKLGLKGDAFTTQLLDLNDWTGPHRRTGAWTTAAKQGHASCAR